MTVDEHKLDEAVIYLDTVINITNSHELKEHVQRLFREGYRKITLDFSRSSMIDASGLGKILMLQRKISEQQGELRIINVTNKYIKRTFDLVQLQKVINIG